MNHIVTQQTKTTTSLSMDFSSANQYIESPKVQSLNVSGPDVHAVLWPTFKQLIAQTDSESGWKYEKSFKYAVTSVMDDYKVKKSDILEDTTYQLRLCFHFMMYLYH